MIPASGNKTNRQHWLAVAVLVGVVYGAVGVGFAFADKVSGPAPIRVWRLAAWLVSAAVFCVHFAHELRLSGNSPLRVAGHVASGAGVGAFLLAAWVNAHGYWATPQQHGPLVLLALVAFPLMTGLAAFVVALAAAAALRRLRSGSASGRS